MAWFAAAMVTIAAGVITLVATKPGLSPAGTGAGA
jgi:hypothetical protein